MIIIVRLKEVKKISLCIISHFGYPLYNKKCIETDIGGGAGVQLYLLSKEFAKPPTINVNIITGNHKTHKNRIEVYQNIKIFKVLPLKRTFFNVLKFIIILFLTLIQIKPDIVIQRTASPVTGLCAFYCKLFRKKFIYSISNKPEVNGKAENGVLGKFYKYGLNNATIIIAQNKDQIDELEKFKKRKIRNIKLIKSGYNIKNKDYIEKKNILWVSRAIEWKRAEIFLKLAQKIPDKDFIIICNKTNNEIYWKTISDNAIKIHNLKFLNFIPFHKIDRYFKKAKIFINTSIYEGFPNTFIQAFKNKTPVISLNVNPDEILTKNKIGIFCHGDLKKLEFSINQLFENQELYDSYSKNAFTYVKNNHDIKIISKKWFGLFEKIIDNH